MQEGDEMKIKHMSINCFCLVLLLSFSIIKDCRACLEPTENSTKPKVIYLTFDDGPSPLTGKFLDVLNRYNVKGTFFLVGNQIPENADTVKRIYEEGHSIGLHTYTHSYRIIYSNRNNFIKEMQQCQDEICSLTGARPIVIRFPGGSQKRLDDDFLTQLHSLNYKVFDWNAYTSDGVDYRLSSERLRNEATKTTITCYPIILLMHCDYVNKNTLSALPWIIKYYQQQGFEFKTITDETQEYYFPIYKRK
jgi:peptidoglycan/xylan/chitin deacetylase (PgdA/CDA1 family)